MPTCVQAGTIPFTQYLRPHGRRQIIVMREVPDDVLAKADEIMSHGFCFEIEELTTGHVSATITDAQGNGGDCAFSLTDNGPALQTGIWTMITNFDPVSQRAQIDARAIEDDEDDEDEDNGDGA